MRYVFLAFILLTFVAAGTYIYLGGLREPAVVLETTAAPLLLAGQPYHGPVSAEGFGQLFRQAKAAQEGGPLAGGALTNLYYNDPEKAQDSIRAFIGLAVAGADSSRPLPPGFRYRLVPAGQRVVAARLRGVSYLLAPNKLYPAAFEFVKARKLTRRPFYVEQFGADEQAQVWVGVK